MAKEVAKKKYLLKTFSVDYSNQLSEIQDAEIRNFSASINSGLGEITMIVERTLQDWNDNEDLKHGQIVELWVNDIDTDFFQRIYVGFISNLNFKQSRSKKQVIIKALGLVSKLTRDLYKNGTTTTISFIATDPSNMFKNIVDKLKDTTNGMGLDYLNYQVNQNPTIEDTGRLLDANFKQLTYQEAFENCRELSPSRWWWYLDAENNLSFKRRDLSTSPDHIFSFANIIDIDINYSMENIINGVYVWDGGINYRFLENKVSRKKYGKRYVKKSFFNKKGREKSSDKITSTSASKLIDAGATFSTDGVAIDDIVYNSTQDTYTRVSGVDSETQLSLDDNIFQANDDWYVVTANNNTILDNVAKSIISDNSYPKVMVRLSLADNNNTTGQLKGYDIESVRIGDMCVIMGVRDNSGRFIRQQMQVVRINYAPTNLVVELEGVVSNEIAENIKEIKKKEDENDKEIREIPDSYTAV